MSGRKVLPQAVTDKASAQMIAKARKENIDTCFSRIDAAGRPCAFGVSGMCCRICNLGPCRITVRNPRGVCGAGADTIVARNFLRQIAAGSAAHCDHARNLVLLLRKAADGDSDDYVIRDRSALRRTAKAYGLSVTGKSDKSLARKLADFWLGDFGSQRRPMRTFGLAPAARRKRWKAAGLDGAGIDRTIVEAMHRTVMGVDHDYRSLLTHGIRTALVDGYGGSTIATLASDILFGTPQPVHSVANLGVLHEDTVNVIVHGHNPAVSEMIARAASDRQVLALARKAGARGLTLAGICCTGQEILHRHGIPLAGGMLQQELAIVTGAVEMMITDVQCCMPGLADAASHYHTELVSTSTIAQTPEFTHEPFDGNGDYAHAKALLSRAVSHFANRDPQKVAIPPEHAPLLAGFSVHAVEHMLGGSVRPLLERLRSGQVKGIVAIIGCSNPKVQADVYAATLARELIGQDVLVLSTGCAGTAAARQGLLSPALAVRQAGKGLREMYKTFGLPPVLHMGSCVSNARMLELGTRLAAQLGKEADIGLLPMAAVAPEWISEKVLAIGLYMVASGIDVILGQEMQVSGSTNVQDFLTRQNQESFGASVQVCADPHQAAQRLENLLAERRRHMRTRT